MGHNPNAFVPETPKRRGKGPRGKKQVRLLRMQKQTEREMTNRARKRADAQYKRVVRQRSDVKTNVLLVKVKDGRL